VKVHGASQSCGLAAEAGEASATLPSAQSSFRVWGLPSAQLSVRGFWIGSSSSGAQSSALGAKPLQFVLSASSVASVAPEPSFSSGG